MPKLWRYYKPQTDIHSRPNGGNPYQLDLHHYQRMINHYGSNSMLLPKFHFLFFLLMAYAAPKPMSSRAPLPRGASWLVFCPWAGSMGAPAPFPALA